MTLILLGLWLLSSAALGIATGRWFGSWFNPVWLMGFRWSGLLLLYSLGLVQFDAVRTSTWVVAIGSVGAFAIGASVPGWVFRGGTVDHRDATASHLRSVVSEIRLRRAVLVLFAIGSILLARYLWTVWHSFGLRTLFETPYVVRQALAEGAIPAGFHYFYVMELVAAIGFVHVFLFRLRKNVVIAVVMTIAAASVVLTTGKVNIAKVLVWWFFLLMFLRIDRPFRASVAMAIPVAMVGFALFATLTVWGGEAFVDTPWSTHVATDWSGSNLTYFYVLSTGPFVALDKLLQDETVIFEWGKYTLLPVVKLLHEAGLPIDVPTHIGRFYDIPIPFNVATYLDVLYTDFGLAGTLVIPVCLGVISGLAYFRLRRTRSLWWVLANSILALWIYASVAAASYIKPSYWFQIMVALLVARYAEGRAALRSRVQNEYPPAPLLTQSSFNTVSRSL